MVNQPSTPERSSHSVWSAWIEMPNTSGRGVCDGVALRLECVDRNIMQNERQQKLLTVALRLECVDRNANLTYPFWFRFGRTPFGVRG